MKKTPFTPTPFMPPLGLKNAHLQTILPKFVRQPVPKYKRELHLDSTGQAAVAYDFVLAGEKRGDTLAVMFHGLEGSSHSHYAKSFANEARRRGCDAVVVHYRGCGGMENPSQMDYNAGQIEEVHYVLSRLSALYPKLVAVGVSLGGNMLAKYMGVYGDKALCRAAVVVSAPVDLGSSAKVLHRFVARHVYAPYLLKSLIKKAAEKLDDPETLEKLHHLKTLDAFDDLYTAPRHGYVNSSDYYTQASALPHLSGVTHPTLIISSDDDPFLGDVAKPSDVSDSVQLLYSKHGGHVGFLQKQNGRFDLGWTARTSFDFFEWALAS